MLSFLHDSQLVLYILQPDTTDVTKQFDQVNQKIHCAYCFTKEELFTPFGIINKEGFMNILGNTWDKWITLDLTNAVKQEGINSKWFKCGLDEPGEV